MLKLTNMFAVVEIGKKQYKVQVGDQIEVDHLEGKIGEILTFARVLLKTDADKTSVGTPDLSGVVAKAKIIGETRGDKVEIRRFKSKVRYRRNKGFRSKLTKLEILSIGSK